MKSSEIRNFIKSNPNDTIIIGLFIENRGDGVVIRHGHKSGEEAFITGEAIKDRRGGVARGTEVMLALRNDKIDIKNAQTTYTCPPPNQIIGASLEGDDLQIQFVRFAK